MKIITTTVLALLLSSATLLASDNHKMGLILALPHPMKAIIPNYEAFNFTPEQDAKVQEIIGDMPSKMHAMFDEAEALEIEITDEVMRHGKTKEQLAEKLDKLQALKREITSLHIDTVVKFRSIMNKKQYKMMMQSLQETKQKKHSHKH